MDTNSSVTDAMRPRAPQLADDEPMTGLQLSYLETLCREAGEELNESLTKFEASQKINELQRKTGRSQSSAAGQNEPASPGGGSPPDG